MNTRNSLHAAQAALLEKAGGSLSLAEAAMALNISPQAVHAQIHAGRALGMMHGDQIVVPRIQFRSCQDGRSEILPGIDRIMRIFLDAQAGSWSALQFLVEWDPNLNATPVAALSVGKVDAVEHAARAYLRAVEE